MNHKNATLADATTATTPVTNLNLEELLAKQASLLAVDYALDLTPKELTLDSTYWDPTTRKEVPFRVTGMKLLLGTKPSTHIETAGQAAKTSELHLTGHPYILDARTGEKTNDIQEGVELHQSFMIKTSDADGEKKFAITRGENTPPVSATNNLLDRTKIPANDITAVLAQVVGSGMIKNVVEYFPLSVRRNAQNNRGLTSGRSGAGTPARRVILPADEDITKTI